MLKLIMCEFAKLKRKKLFQAAFLTTAIMPFFYSLLLSSADLDDMMSVVREENGFIILIPLSVVIAANLFFEEFDYDTLKNLLCVPIKKSHLAVAKLLVLLLFMVGYQLTGYVITMIMAVTSGRVLDGWGLQFLLTFGSAVLLWCASLPCILLVVWFNKSYIISVIIAFAYMVLGYITHFSDALVMTPLGLNIATFLPVPMIFRWLYQFHAVRGGETAAFYERFRPYFVPTHIVFAVLLAEAVVCVALMTKIYRKQSV